MPADLVFRVVDPYLDPPRSTVMYRTFLESCETRLKMFEVLQDSSEKFEPHSAEWNQFVFELLLERSLQVYFNLFDAELLKKRYPEMQCQGEPENGLTIETCLETDILGHAGLSFGCCKDEEFKRMYLKLERAWFRLRFNHFPQEKILEYLEWYKISLGRACEQENIQLMEEVERFYGCKSKILFKANFFEAPSLIKNREVILRGGFMYFGVEYVERYLEDFLAKDWKKMLEIEAQHRFGAMEIMGELEGDLRPSIKSVFHRAGTCPEGLLKLANIEQHSQKFFPLCMRRLHGYLKQEGHLKHFSREQFAVFLKNAGMSYHDAMEFFKAAFARNMDEETYRKRKYAYYFSHFFGREGGRIQYPPQTCEQIVACAPAVMQKNGCPFAHYDSSNLKEALKGASVDEPTLSDIVDLAEKNRFKAACRRFYSYDTGRVMQDHLEGPNGYYFTALRDHYKLPDIEDIFGDSDD